MENLANAGDGLFEVAIDVGDETGGMCFQFAEQIVAVAMSRNKRPNETSREYLERTFGAEYRQYRARVRRWI